MYAFNRYASGQKAECVGKPELHFYQSALDQLGLPASEVAMIGDDICDDVIGAQALGMYGVLVQTGKYRPGDESRGPPDHVASSLYHAIEWLLSQKTS